MGSLSCPLCCKHLLPYLELKMHLTAYVKGPLECPVCMLSVVGVENLLRHLSEHDSNQGNLSGNVDVNNLILNGNLLTSCENMNVYDVSKLGQDTLGQPDDQTVLQLEDKELFEASNNLLQMCAEDNNINSSLNKAGTGSNGIEPSNSQNEFVESDDVTNIINSENVLLNPSMDEDSILQDLMYICVKCGVEYQSVETLQDHAKCIHGIDHMDLEVTPKITSQKTMKSLLDCPGNNLVVSQTGELVNNSVFVPFSSGNNSFLPLDGNEMCNFSVLATNEAQPVSTLSPQKVSKTCKSYDITAEETELVNYLALTLNDPESVTCLPARKTMLADKTSSDASIERNEMPDYTALAINEPELVSLLPVQKVMLKDDKIYNVRSEDSDFVSYLAYSINEPPIDCRVPEQKLSSDGKKPYSIEVNEHERCSYSSVGIGESEIGNCVSPEEINKTEHLYTNSADRSVMSNSPNLSISETQVANCLPSELMVANGAESYGSFLDDDLSGCKPERVPFSRACEKCGRVFNRQDRYEAHVLIHTDRSSWPLECGVCKQRYITKDVLDRHTRNVHQQHPPRIRAVRNGARGPPKECICQSCGQGFSKTTYLRKHIFRCHKNESVGHFKCKFCEKTFFSRPDLKEHIERTHVKVKRCVCNICGKQFFDSGALKSHLNTHSEFKPHACSYCEKRYSYRSELKRHELTHTGEKPVACNICGKRFRTTYFLNNHIRSHTGEKPFVCPTCNMAFSTSKSLKNHMLIHADIKQFDCSYCNKTFKTQIQLYNHVRIHTRPFKCQVCEKDFDSVNTLNRHHLAQHSKDYRCKICGEQFTNLKKYFHHEKHCTITPSLPVQ